MQLQEAKAKAKVVQTVLTEANRLEIGASVQSRTLQPSLMIKIINQIVLVGLCKSKEL